jgi:FKBP12-rapamycin complex-associated protein
VIRETVLASLDPVLDVYLAQPENIRTLFSALNDEMFEIREKAIAIFGRLSVRNPAYIMPSMRKILIQLLTELGTHTITLSHTFFLYLSLEFVTLSLIVM